MGRRGADGLGGRGGGAGLPIDPDSLLQVYALGERGEKNVSGTYTDYAYNASGEPIGEKVARTSGFCDSTMASAPLSRLASSKPPPVYTPTGFVT